MCHVSLSTVRQFPCPRDLISDAPPRAARNGIWRATGLSTSQDGQSFLCNLCHRSRDMDTLLCLLPMGIFITWRNKRTMTHYNRPTHLLLWAVTLDKFWRDYENQSRAQKQIHKCRRDATTESLPCTPTGTPHWSPRLPVTTISLINGNSSFRSLLTDYFI